MASEMRLMSVFVRWSVCGAPSVRRRCCVCATLVVSASLCNVVARTALCGPVVRACGAPCMSAGSSVCLVCQCQGVRPPTEGVVA